MKKCFAVLCLVASLLFTWMALAPPPQSQATTTTIYGASISDTVSKVIARVSSQTLTSGTSMTKLQLATEDKDTRSEFSTSTYKYTAKSPGMYVVGATAKFTESDNGTRELAVYLNGATSDIRACVPSQDNAPAIYVNIDGVMDLDAGDYLELYGRQDCGDNITMDNATSFHVMKLP